MQEPIPPSRSVLSMLSVARGSVLSVLSVARGSVLSVLSVARESVLSVALAVLSVASHGCTRAADPVAPPAAVPAFSWQLPPGLPVPKVPADNPMTVAGIELGRRLFYDTRLSGNGTFSCATCHQQRHAFTDGRPRAIGSTGAAHARSAMSLTNVAYNASLGWADPALRTLEAQMAVPMFNEHPIELGLKGREAEVVSRLSAEPGDRARFHAAFPGEASPVTLGNVVKAIAAFERTLVSGDSPLDRYLYRDDKSAMSAPALRGMKAFFSRRLRCAECHGSFNLSGPVDFEGAATTGQTVALLFHNTGLYDVDGRGTYPAIDRGLVDLTARTGDMGRFRAPTLRNIAVTAPYMHDGSIATLDAAIAHYASGGKPSPFRSDRVRGFLMSAGDRADLVAFLESLTDQGFLTNPSFAPPGAESREQAKTADGRPNLHGVPGTSQERVPSP
jgi:cytochrome c peroxidase